MDPGNAGPVGRGWAALVAGVIFNVEPIGKPRQTRSTFSGGKKRPRIAAYHAFRDVVRLQARGWEPGGELALRFEIAMPKSWSGVKKSRMLGVPHACRPDLDNLIKSFLDVWPEDCHVWWIQAEKCWSTSGAIIVDGEP